MIRMAEQKEYTITQPLQRNGVISIPKPIREKMGLKVGDLVIAKIRKT